MINIWFNREGMPYSYTNYVASPDLWFDNRGGRKYITGDIERQMIRDIDNTEVVSENLLISPILGPIPPDYLSGSVKTLILVKNDQEHIFNGSFMGNICCEWLQRLGEMQDITFRLGYTMKFKEPLAVRILNNNKIYTTFEEYAFDSGKFY